MFSRTPGWDFRCFYPCKIFLSHIHDIPVPARGIDENEQPHAGRMAIINVIEMLK